MPETRVALIGLALGERPRPDPGPGGPDRRRPGSPLVRTLSARMTARDHTPNFVLRLMAKDRTYALAEGRRHGLALSTVASALALLEQAITAGHGEEDFSALVEPVRKSARD